MSFQRSVRPRQRISLTRCRTLSIAFVPLGVDAKKAARFTALMEEGLELLASLEADLALLEKKAAEARLKKATGKLTQPG